MSRPDRIRAGWLEAPASLAVMAALEAVKPGASRYVGGCIRNTLRGLAADDIDIATQLVPERVVEALQARNIRALPTGLSHGTVTALCHGVAIEVTTLRRDVETDGRRAVVAFTDDWQEDAGRRDFRMNSIYAGPDGQLYEPIPGSVEDAILGRVIFIGNADARLEEDYLRILRFYRFNAWYAQGIDEAGQAACGRQRQGLRRIAAERVWKELRRTLSAPDPAGALLAMDRSGVLGVILPEASPHDLPGLIEAERTAGLAGDPLRRLMALLPREPATLSVLARRLRLSGAEAARLAAWADPVVPDVASLDPAHLVQALYWHDTGAILDQALLSAAADGRVLAPAVLDALKGWQRPVFPITGSDALAAGHAGAGVGEWLRALERDWVNSGFRLTRAQLLARRG